MLRIVETTVATTLNNVQLYQLTYSSLLGADYTYCELILECVANIHLEGVMIFSRLFVCWAYDFRKTGMLLRLVC